MKMNPEVMHREMVIPSLIQLFVIIITRIAQYALAECDVCQPNLVACHSDTVFSVCNNGIATYNYITCPEGYVCTAENFICYPQKAVGVVQSCKRYAENIHLRKKQPNICGICDKRFKVFSCINETAIAFCFGRDEPYYESVSICPEGTVCDLYNDLEFCSERTEARPSCITETNGAEISSTITTTTTTTTITKIPTTKGKCGICDDLYKVFSCINETAIAFCFGRDEPHYESVSICPEGTVCDLNNHLEFCSKITEARPSCITGADFTISTPTSHAPITTTATTTTTTMRAITTSIQLPTSTTTTRTTTSILIAPTPTPTTSSSTTTTARHSPLTSLTIKASTLPTPTRRITTTTSTTNQPTMMTTVSTTTTNTIFDINAFCQERGKNRGSYSLEGDTTCTKFIFCTRKGGKIKYCEDGEFFNSDFGQCTKVKPANCL